MVSTRVLVFLVLCFCFLQVLAKPTPDSADTGIQGQIDQGFQNLKAQFDQLLQNFDSEKLGKAVTDGVKQFGAKIEELSTQLKTSAGN